MCPHIDETDMDLLANFKERFAERFAESALAPAELAAHIGVTSTSVYRYLEGKHIPPFAEFVKLADLFRCSGDYLLGLTDEYAAIPFKAPPPFSEQIRFLLQHFGISEYALHKNTEISRSLLHSWKKGATCPSVPNLVKLAALFGCSVDFVIGREC